jgi:hypothetical protein
MSCCGENRNKQENNQGNQGNYVAGVNGMVQQQPGIQPGMIHQPQPVAMSPPPLSYQPQRQSSYGLPSLHSNQPNGMGGMQMNQFGQFILPPAPSSTLVNTQPPSVHGEEPTASSLRDSMISPPPMAMYPTGGGMGQFGGGMGMGAVPAQIVSYAPPQAPEDGRISVSIDFGTAFSGVVSLLLFINHRARADDKFARRLRRLVSQEATCSRS